MRTLELASKCKILLSSHSSGNFLFASNLVHRVEFLDSVLLSVEFFSPHNPQKRRVLKAPYDDKLYTELPLHVLEELGVKTDLEINYLMSPTDSGRLINLPLWRVGVRINGYECITPAIPGKEAVIGFLTLAELGLRFMSDSEKSKMTAYNDVLIYDFLFDWVPHVYESIYSVKVAKELYDELILLYNDWIEVVKEDILQSWKTSSFAVAIMSIVHYNLYLMRASLYTGLLPSIAYGIRASLEALIAGYFGDLYQKFIERYRDPLVRLDRAMTFIRKRGFRKMCREYLQKYFDDVDSVLSLWNDLSFGFVHSIGLIRSILRSPTLPSVGMGIPFAGYEGDEQQLMQLLIYLKKYREIFNELFEAWRRCVHAL